MNLYHGAKTKVRVGTELFEKFLLQVGVHRGSVLSPLLFAMTVDEILKIPRIDNEILYANDLVSMSKSIENLKNKFFKWEEPFESKGLKMSLKKTKANSKWFER